MGIQTIARSVVACGNSKPHGAFHRQIVWGSPNPVTIISETNSGKPQYWVWEVPDTIAQNDECVFRIRYDISTGDFNKKDDSDFDPFQDLDQVFNGANAPLK